jgi:hypothetical protein
VQELLDTPGTEQRAVQFPEIAGVSEFFSVFSRHDIPIGRVRSAYPGVRFVLDHLPLTSTSNVADAVRLQRVVSSMKRFGLLPRSTRFQVTSMIAG